MGTTAKDLTFMSAETQKERRKSEANRSTVYNCQDMEAT